MAAAAIEVITGVHPHPGYIGTYKNRSECLELIRRETGRSGVEFIWRQVMAENLIQERGINFAQRGDPVMIRRGSGHSIGIVGMDGALIVAAARGLVRIDRSKALTSWSIQ